MLLLFDDVKPITFHMITLELQALNNMLGGTVLNHDHVSKAKIELESVGRSLVRLIDPKGEEESGEEVGDMT